jgi:hypothetical protein
MTAASSSFDDFASARGGPSPTNTEASATATALDGVGGAGPPAVAVGVTHTLEWHVAAYTVPWKKTSKNILSHVGACVRVCVCSPALCVCGMVHVRLE